MLKEKNLTLRTSDNVDFIVGESTAIVSKTIKALVEDECASSIIILQVGSETMPKVIDYCKEHAREENICEEQKLKLKEFDANFVKELDMDTLYRLLMAANFLEISGLLDIILQKVADMCKGKKVEELRDMFGIQNDFLEGEEDEIKNKDPWAFDY